MKLSKFEIVIKYITDYSNHNKFGPNIKCICKALNLSSYSVTGYVKQGRDKGILKGPLVANGPIYLAKKYVEIPKVEIMEKEKTPEDFRRESIERLLTQHNQHWEQYNNHFAECKRIQKLLEAFNVVDDAIKFEWTKEQLQQIKEAANKLQIDPNWIVSVIQPEIELSSAFQPEIELSEKQVIGLAWLQSLEPLDPSEVDHDPEYSQHWEEEATTG